MLEVGRIWFVLPDPQPPAPALVMPIDNTLCLHIEMLNSAGRNNIHVGKTAFKFLGTPLSGPGHQISYETSPTGDPGQEANSLYPGTDMVFPLGHNVQPGDMVIAKNECRVKLDLPGASRSARKLRVSLRQRDGTVYYGGTAPNTPMDNVRIYFDFYLWCEKRT